MSGPHRKARSLARVCCYVLTKVAVVVTLCSCFPVGLSCCPNVPSEYWAGLDESLSRFRTGGWQSRGPGGGGALYSPAISPHGGREIYMASDMGGMYHSLDFGLHWQLVPFPTMRTSNRAQVRFTNSPKVLYATDIPWNPPAKARLLKSLDGGWTWDAQINTPGQTSTLRSLLVDPGSTNRLLYSDYSRLYFSKDGGQAYTEAYSTKSDAGIVVGGAFWDGDTIYVGISDGVLVSRDSGNSFALDPTLSTGFPVGVSIVSFAGARRGGVARLFAVTFSGRSADGNVTVSADITGGALDLFAGLYRMNLGESSWQRTPSELGPDDKLAFVAMSSRNPDVAYVAGGNRSPSTKGPLSGLAPIVMRTSDGGTHWQHVFNTDHNSNVDTGWSGYGGDMHWHFGEYALGLAVSETDPKRVVLTDLGFVHVTDDGGKRWRQAYTLAKDGNPPGKDTPKSRTYRSNGLEPTSGWWLTWSAPNTVFASLTDIVSAFSADNGVSWSRDGQNGLTLNTTYHVVQHPMTGTLYSATAKTHDIYQSPFLRDSRLDGNAPRGAPGAVMKSEDFGTSWTPLYDYGRPVVWLALDPNHPNLLYASVVNSTTGGIYRMVLDNLELPAEALPAPPRTKGHPFNVHVLSDGTIVTTYSGHQDGNTRVFADRSGVFALPASALAWEDRSAPEMHYWTKDIVIDPANDNRWYVGVFSHDSRNFGGLYRTHDRGLSWVRISEQYRVDSCTIDPKNPRRMYMTTEDQGLWLSEDIDSPMPTFRRVEDYPFQHPTRVFFNPYDPAEVWTTSFGGGIRMKRELTRIHGHRRR